jgi:alanine dehydrogenase
MVGIPRETFHGERRVALTPRACEALLRAQLSVVAGYSAGLEAGFSDEEYARRGVRLGTRDEVLSSSEMIVQARTPFAKMSKSPKRAFRTSRWN